MHSSLRDRFSGLSVSLDLLVLLASAVVAIGTFLDPAVASAMRLDAGGLQLVVGGAGMVIFGLSLISLRIDWKRREVGHREAARVLSGLKRQARGLLAGETDDQEYAAFFELADGSLSGLPKIPERHFLRLKSQHLRKVRLSRILDRHPSALIWLVAIRLRIRDSWGALRSEASDSSKGPE